MAKSTIKANEIISRINQGELIELIKAETSSTADEWHRYSSKAYKIYYDQAKKERASIENRPHVSAKSNSEILEIITLNETLANFALLLPIFSTNGEFQAIKTLAEGLPTTESEIIKIIGKMTLHPRLRALQKRGRIEKFDHFRVFSKMVDAAILSYYRTNFISCYLTLLPIIEGIIIRWMGYNSLAPKPEFEDIRRFFKISAQRQPCPHNVLFHNVFVKACDKILNNHFYLPTANGNAYANFNRHVASHLLNDNHFATKENCIRLFILLDAMTEIFQYESRDNDPRFNLGNEEIAKDIELFGIVILDNLEKTSEQHILGTDISDIKI